MNRSLANNITSCLEFLAVVATGLLHLVFKSLGAKGLFIALASVSWIGYIVWQGAAGFKPVGEVGFSNKESFVCLFLAHRDICRRGSAYGLVWAGQWSRTLARPHSCFCYALSVMGDSSAISGASTGCRQSDDTLSKAGLDGGDACGDCAVFFHPLSQWFADARDRVNGGLVYPLLSP